MNQGFKVVRRDPNNDRLISAVFDVLWVEYEIGRPARPPRKWQLGEKTAGPGAGPLAVFKDRALAAMWMDWMRGRQYPGTGDMEIYSCRYKPSADFALWCYDAGRYKETLRRCMPQGSDLADEVTLLAKAGRKFDL